MITFEENEIVLYTARKHWFIFVTEILFALVLAALPLLFMVIPPQFFKTILETFRFDGNPFVLFLFLWSLWLLLLWVVAMLFWTDYYLDVWFVTNHRVIDIDQRGMFNRRVNSFRYGQIQDATVDVPGVLATLIDFGTVRLRTASNETFSIRGVAHPQVLRDKILSEQHRVHTSSALQQNN